MIKTLVATTLLLFSSITMADVEINLRASAGEWGNKDHTERYSVQATKYFSKGFITAKSELQDHPYDDVGNQVMAGGGVIFLDKLHFQAMFGEERWRGDVFYRDNIDNWLFEGGFWTSNKYQGGSSQTWLQTSVGYQLTDGIAVGAFYETGHVSRSVVDDQYGAFIRFNF